MEKFRKTGRFGVAGVGNSGEGVGLGLSQTTWACGFCRCRLNIRFKFQAMLTNVHSPDTAFNPRSRNWRKPSTDLMMPNTTVPPCIAPPINGPAFQVSPEEARATYSICAQATGVSWQFSGGGGTASQSGGTSWSGTMVTSGTVTVSFTLKGLPYTRTKSVTVINRSWHTNPASAAQVPNGSFITLPVPPQSSGQDSGLGQFEERTGDPGGWASTAITDNGPNKGYVYYAAALNVSTLLFRYEINPDLENSGSTFSQKQCGNYNATTNPGGFISWSNLLAQTRRHEYNSSTQSHYAFYKNAMNSSANNPGDYFESRVGTPGTSTSSFDSATRTDLNTRYSQIKTQSQVEPFAVNHSESNVFLGNINYGPPYANCP